MTTQEIVADAQPFVNSKLPIHLKVIAAKRIRLATTHRYKHYLPIQDKLLSNFESLGVFDSERSLKYALKTAKTTAAEISNEALIKLLLEQQRLQKIFKKINQKGSFDSLACAEIEYLLQHSAKNVRAFVNKYQLQLEQALEAHLSEEISSYIN